MIRLQTGINSTSQETIHHHGKETNNNLNWKHPLGASSSARFIAKKKVVTWRSKRKASTTTRHALQRRHGRRDAARRARVHRHRPPPSRTSRRPCSRAAASVCPWSRRILAAAGPCHDRLRLGFGTASRQQGQHRFQNLRWRFRWRIAWWFLASGHPKCLVVASTRINHNLNFLSIKKWKTSANQLEALEIR